MRPLELSREEFRRLSQQITELSSEFLFSIDSQRIFPETSGTESEGLFTTALPENGSIVTRVKSRRTAPGFGTIYLDIPLTHGDNLGVWSTIFVLHTANELSCLALIPKLQLSVAERKCVPPAHKY